MATRTGQKNQNQWMEDEVEDLKVLMDKLGRSLPMGKLKALLVLEEPKEAYPPFKRLIEGQGNGGTPRTLSGLQSKAKKLALEQKEEKGEKEKGKKKEQGGKEKDLDKALATAKANLKSVLRDIPDPDVYDHLGQDKVTELLTAEEMRCDRKERKMENHPPPVTKVRESWANLPALGEADDGLHLDAVQFRQPPPMDLKPGEDGFWLIRPLTKATPKEEYVGVPAPQTPKDWEEPAKFLDAIKLQVTKDPNLVFAPVPKPILPYKDLFGKNKVWEKVEEERELGLTKDWVKKLNGKGTKEWDLRPG